MPPSGRPAPARTGRTRAAGPRGGTPGRRRRRGSGRPAVGAPTTLHRRPPRRVPDGVVDQDRDELAEPGRVGVSGTGSASASMRTSRSARAAPGRRRRRARGRPRSVGSSASSTAPESVRASRSRSSTRAPQPVGLGLDVVEGIADLGDRLVGVAAEVRDGALDDRERRPQLVAGVGRELALAAHRVADRHERPVGVDPADAERRREGQRGRRGRGRSAGRSASAARPIRSPTTWTTKMPCGAGPAAVRQDPERGPGDARRARSTRGRSARLGDAGRRRAADGVSKPARRRPNAAVGPDDEGDRAGRRPADEADAPGRPGSTDRLPKAGRAVQRERRRQAGRGAAWSGALAELLGRRAARELATATYRRVPSMTSTTSVVPPLQAAAASRTRRTSAASGRPRAHESASR